MGTYIQTNKDLNSYGLKKKYLKGYKKGDRLHIVDFDKDRSYLGVLESKNKDLLIIKLDKGYSISISWLDLHCKRFGINNVLREYVTIFKKIK